MQQIELVVSQLTTGHLSPYKSSHIHVVNAAKVHKYK